MYWQQVQVQKRHSGLSVYEHRSLCRKKKGQDTYALCKNVVQLGILDSSKESDGCVPLAAILCVSLALIVLVCDWGLALVCRVLRHFSVSAGCAIKADAMCDPKFPRERRVEGRHQYGGCVAADSGTPLISPPHYSCSTCTPPPPGVLPLLSAPRQRTAGWHTQPPCTLARPPPPPQTSATRPAIQPWPCQAQQHVSPVPATSTTLS